MGNAQAKENPNGLSPSSTSSHSSRRVSTGDYNRLVSNASSYNATGIAASPHNPSRHRSSSLLNPSTTRISSSTKGSNYDSSATSRLVLCHNSQMVDEGFLVPQGIYTSPQDFDFAIVQHLIINRRLAPFYKGLVDFDDNWNERELLRALRVGNIQGDNNKGGKSETGKSEIGKVVIDKSATPAVSIPLVNQTPQNILIQALNDISLSRSAPLESSFQGGPCPSNQSNVDSNQDLTPTSASPSVHTYSPSSPPALIREASTVSIGRTRANTTTRYDTAKVENKAPSVSPEVIIYSHAIECPICFLYYPPTINVTRCCEQPICTECFVQIKRADPHPPHDEPTSGNRPTAQISNNDELISEPACCPYCAQSDFGVIFNPPTIRTGVMSNNNNNHNQLDIGPANMPSGISTPCSGNSSSASITTSRRRSSVPATHDNVVTIDKIRPSWCTTLAAARARKARKSAHASQLHATMANGATEIEIRSLRRSGTSIGSSGGFMGNNRIGGFNGIGPFSGRGTGNEMTKREWRELAKQQELEDIMLAEALRLSLLED